MKKVSIALIVVALTISMVFIGFGCKASTAATETAAAATTTASETTASETTAPETTAAKEHIVMGLVHMSTTHPYHIAELNGSRELARRRGAEMIITTGEFVLENQIAATEDLLASRGKDLDVITILPLDQNAFLPIYDKIVKMGIPLVTIQSYNPPEQAEMIIGYEEFACSATAGEYVVKLLTERYGEPKGQVAAIGGVLGQDAHEYRSKGFKSVIDQYPNIKLVAITPADYLADKALVVMEDYITTYPDLDAVFCFADEMGVAAAQAIEAAGKSEQIMVVGYGGTQMDAVKEGKMIATIKLELGPESAGYLHQYWAYKVAIGEEIPNREVRGLGYVMDKTNVDKWQKLMDAVNADIESFPFENEQGVFDSESVLREYGILE